MVSTPFIACGSCQLQINSEENYYTPLEEEMTTSINVAYHTSSSRLLSNSMNLDRSNLQSIDNDEDCYDYI